MAKTQRPARALLVLLFAGVAIASVASESVKSSGVPRRMMLQAAAPATPAAAAPAQPASATPALASAVDAKPNKAEAAPEVVAVKAVASADGADKARAPAAQEAVVTKPEVKSEAKPEAKPETKPEAKPVAPEVAPKPAAADGADKVKAPAAEAGKPQANAAPAPGSPALWVAPGAAAACPPCECACRKPLSAGALLNARAAAPRQTPPFPFPEFLMRPGPGGIPTIPGFYPRMQPLGPFAWAPTPFLAGRSLRDAATGCPPCVCACAGAAGSAAGGAAAGAGDKPKEPLADDGADGEEPDFIFALPRPAPRIPAGWPSPYGPPQLPIFGLAPPHPLAAPRPRSPWQPEPAFGGPAPWGPVGSPLVSIGVAAGPVLTRIDGHFWAPPTAPAKPNTHGTRGESQKAPGSPARKAESKRGPPVPAAAAAPAAAAVEAAAAKAKERAHVPQAVTAPDAMARANEYRARHGAAALSWDGELAYRAAAAASDFGTSVTSRAGEAVAWGHSNGSKAADAFYSEVGRRVPKA